MDIHIILQESHNNKRVLIDGHTHNTAQVVITYTRNTYKDTNKYDTVN